LYIIIIISNLIRILETGNIVTRPDRPLRPVAYTPEGMLVGAFTSILCRDSKFVELYLHFPYTEW